ncbi:NAD-dependent epimerase/dehydratase [Desulfonatronospira thiodismutans ASO3-1]|uniref:NAD-dependent epimerase/dehydratase n=1 Tax=Desulfonatronospira thiodismutans ASO3-1 TaxID=555779 RepID=D6SN96_9BACT|nr:NAD-dependent epimerase/dehydratase family protein [Desulfonatronospira thiodismutans]EFI34222.1 NAD-dependent epimerase/dehydratase [Desulfonatronospira thiodismutans ASO3-1]
MDKVVITGGCGFIGLNTIDYLKKNKSHLKISVLDNESLGRKEYLKEFEGLEFFSGDIRDSDLVDRVLYGADAVVHLAADTRVLDSIADPVKNFQINVLGTFNVLNAVRNHSVPLLVNASTGGAILGEVSPPVHENMIPEPISPYGASKLSIEGYCSAFSGSYGVKASSLRFSNVYGPRSYHKGSVVAAFFKRILADKPIDVYGDGTQIRDYVYVDDICQGIYSSLNIGAEGVYQLGTGIPTSINQLIEIMQDVVGEYRDIKVRYHGFREGEIHTTYCDISKAEKALRYHPKTELTQGLKLTWEWFKNCTQP